MSIKYRVIAEDELQHWRSMVRRGFNAQIHPDEIERMRKDRADADRLFGAYEDGILVATGGTDSHVMSVPGGAELPTAAIAYVGTAATHRRRGLLTGMMRSLLDQSRDREEPLSVLWASESGIYSRYGFGQATFAEGWEIDPSRSAFAYMPHVSQAGGRLRFVEHDEALRIMPGVWKRAAGQRAGFLDRSARRWRYFFFDEEQVRGDWSGMFHVVYEYEGEPQAYAAYHLQPTAPGEDSNKMEVVECVATTDHAHAAIWRLLLDVDLVESVTAPIRPPDDPLWWMLADPRRLKRTPIDGIWARVIDPIKALSGRSYSAEGRLVIEVSDPFLPETGGVFELECAGDGADCRRSNSKPDISMSAADLGAVYLGGTRLTDLARAGRVVEHEGGSVRLFDRLFQTDRAPWCAHHF